MRVFSQISLLTFSVVLSLAATTNLLAADKALSDRIGGLVRPYLDNEVVTGMTIGVLHKGETTLLGYGRLGADLSQKPDGDTIYEIGSVTKVFTGILLADEVIQGRVKLDEAAGELLPSGVKMPSHGNRAITLQDLSTHVSGLPRLPDNLIMTVPDNPYSTYTVKDLYAFLNSYKLSRDPGSKSEYSNLGQGLLGQLLAHEQNITYEELLRQRITTPLNMTSTTITLDKEQRLRLAPPHLADGQPASNWDIPTLAGAGAIQHSQRYVAICRSKSLPPIRQTWRSD